MPRVPRLSGRERVVAELLILNGSEEPLAQECGPPSPADGSSPTDMARRDQSLSVGPRSGPYHLGVMSPPSFERARRDLVALCWSLSSKSCCYRSGDKISNHRAPRTFPRVNEGRLPLASTVSTSSPEPREPPTGEPPSPGRS